MLFLLIVPLQAILASLIHFPARASALQTHTVYVGVNGSFFYPSTIEVRKDDRVQFVFGADVHAVTQSSFEEPCTRLEGGFSSGLAGVPGAGFSPNTEKPIPTWELTITDDSKPIYYMCDSIDPLYHCTASMVGIINPIDSESFSDLAAAARQASSTPTVTPSVILTGQGAYATTTPTPSPQSKQSDNVPSDDGANDTMRAGIIAGSIIGACLLLGIIVFFVVRRTRKRRKFIINKFTFDSPPNSGKVPLTDPSPPSTFSPTFSSGLPTVTARSAGPNDGRAPSPVESLEPSRVPGTSKASAPWSRSDHLAPGSSSHFPLHPAAIHVDSFRESLSSYNPHTPLASSINSALPSHFTLFPISPLTATSAIPSPSIPRLTTTVQTSSLPSPTTPRGPRPLPTPTPKSPRPTKGDNRISLPQPPMTPTPAYSVHDPLAHNGSQLSFEEQQHSNRQHLLSLNSNS